MDPKCTPVGGVRINLTLMGILDVGRVPQSQLVFDRRTGGGEALILNSEFNHIHTLIQSN